jgi:hypothetical protein
MVKITAPTLAADTVYVFPDAKPVLTNGYLKSTTGGVMTWDETVLESDLPYNKVKTYAGGYYLLAGDDAPLKKPTISATFATTGDNSFVADVTLLCVDHMSTENVATLKFTAVGGKLSGASGTVISVGNVQSTGAAGAAWSTSVATTASKVTMEKSANLAEGNYSVMLHVSILNGTVLKFINEFGPVDLATFTY